MNEIITLITVAKALGFDLSRILEIALIFFMVLTSVCFLFWRISKAVIDAANRATASVEHLTKAFEEHISRNDERLTEGDRRFQILELRVDKLETQIEGLLIIPEGVT